MFPIKKRTDPMTRLFHTFTVFMLFQFLFFTNILNLVGASEDSDLMELGHQALTAGNYETAEDFFKKALEIRPGNYLATRDLAKVKIELGKFNEALSLLNNLLKLPIA